MTRSEFDASHGLQQQAQCMHVGCTFHVPGKGHYKKPRGIFAFLYALLASF